MRSKYNKFLTVLSIILIIAILGILGYLGYDYYEKYRITKEANDFLSEFDELVVELANEENNNTNTTTPNNSTGKPRGISTDALYYRGYKVVGKIEMPSVNLQYPVLDVLTDAKAIEYSVAIQYGVGLNQIGNTVIIGHNYRSGLFFGSNKKMQIGDKVYITDLEGKKICYVIYNKYKTPQEDFSYANRNTDGKREITLVTCDSNNKNRLVICAKEE